MVKIKAIHMKEDSGNKYLDFVLDQLGPSSEDWPHETIRTLFVRFPRLLYHESKYPQKGGFLRVVREGTTFAHVAQHIAMTLQQKEMEDMENIRLNEHNELVLSLPCVDYEEGIQAFRYALRWLHQVMQRHQSDFNPS